MITLMVKGMWTSEIQYENRALIGLLLLAPGREEVIAIV